MNYKVLELEKRKNAFIKASSLVEFMRNYSNSLDENERKKLEILAEVSNGLPLPSGRWGNAIALALELNDYTSALLLIQKSEELKLSTDIVVSEYGFKNPWNLKEEYLFSQLTISGEPIPKAFFKDYEYERYRYFYNKNIDSNYEIAKMLELSKNNIKKIRKI